LYDEAVVEGAVIERGEKTYHIVFDVDEVGVGR
jgi:hypothetical protein